MSRLLYLDCFSGVSGDMLLGALIDAGLPIEALREALGGLALEGDVAVERVTRSGIGAAWFRVVLPGSGDPAPGGGRVQGHEHRHTHGHTHGPGHDHGHRHPHPPDAIRQGPHEHRTLDQIDALIGRSALSDATRARARQLFRRLGEAEAAIHQVPLDRVHLHEVGALDSIVDIVGAVFGLEWMRADRIVVSPLNVGAGMVECAHGTFPVPAPATLRLLEGVPVYSRGPSAELVTPTGALLATGCADAFGPLPAMTVAAVGYGAGSRDFDGWPNVLRVVIGESAPEPGFERVGVLEFEVDDMNPQIFGVLMDALYAEGAVEVFYAAVQMKKNRPGVLVTVVGPPGRREALSAVVFRETTTIGVRYQEVERERLARESVTIDTPIGAVRFKLAWRAGRLVNAAPEFDDCRRLAAERGLPVKEVQAMATKAFLDTRRGE